MLTFMKKKKESRKVVDTFLAGVPFPEEGRDPEEFWWHIQEHGDMGMEYKFTSFEHGLFNERCLLCGHKQVVGIWMDMRRLFLGDDHGDPENGVYHYPAQRLGSWWGRLLRIPDGTLCLWCSHFHGDEKIDQIAFEINELYGVEYDILTEEEG